MEDVYQRAFVIALELADHVGVQIVEALGEGNWGYAALLADGMVLKITTDETEPGCVEEIVKKKGWELTPHLPFIKEYGWYEDVFYYIREFSNPIEEADVNIQTGYWGPEYAEWVSRILGQPIREISDVLGCSLHRDAADYTNWGIRPSDGVLVWRDLSCTCE